MSTQYDNIGERYSATKRLREGVLEEAALKNYVGDASGLEVLDLACGTGFFSQRLVEWGAKKVVGLDISTAMVAEARRLSSGDNRFDFRVADCSSPLDVGRFDLVLEHVKGGVKCQISVHGFSFETFVLEQELYEKCAKHAGIRNLQWMPPTNPNDPQIDFEDFLVCPHFRLFIASST